MTKEDFDNIRVLTPSEQHDKLVRHLKTKSYEDIATTILDLLATKRRLQDEVAYSTMPNSEIAQVLSHLARLIEVK